jgi:hypothetical protein
MPDFPADTDIWYRLAHDGFIMGSEPLGRWMHYVFFQLTGSRTLALMLPSVLAGLIFAGGSWRLLKDMYPQHFTKAFAFVLLAPYSMFFVGYPGTCPLAYAFTGLYFLAGLNFIRSSPPRAPWAESLLLALAVWSHGMALWVTGAHLALVVIWLGRLPAGRPLATMSRFIALCALPFSLLAATLLYARTFGTGFDPSPWYGNAGGGWGGLFVAWRGYDARMAEFVSWGLYSPGHLLGILGMTARLAPAALALPFVWRSTRESTFLLAGLLGGLLLVTVWNLDFGFYRDETLALYSVPAHLYLLWRFVTHRRFAWLIAGGGLALVYALSSGPSWSVPEAMKSAPIQTGTGADVVRSPARGGGYSILSATSGSTRAALRAG